MRKGAFQSPPPMREATSCQRFEKLCCVFQSPPPMREATGRFCRLGRFKLISIPASHAGGDKASSISSICSLGFQSPPPMREATGGNLPATSNFKSFQSPPPMREATVETELISYKR